MSKSVDQKVVQMQFDNTGFEQNAKQTMSTLDKLKAALKFDGANKGAEELNNSIKKIDFSQAEIAATRAGFHIQDVWLKISNVLEYQIARKIIAIGENMAKSLTLDQVTAGFHEYELKMGSIQTIMASTGEELSVVNKYLNELNEYSDKTIYSFSDMTQNIGKFTNAGVKLKDAVAAIQGVANVAAVSGANANEASRAMYNFAQALSAGYVKLIDWKSIENANMATVEFKDTLLQMAVAMGTAKEAGDGMYKILTTNAQGKTMDGLVSSTKNFNDSLQQQWMTTGVLTQALEIYSKDVRTMSVAEKEAYEQKLKGLGFTDKQIEQFEELGIKATKAASEVKTFSQLMDTIKESIGSGWAMSFEHIIGDFNEAKELFTDINDQVGVIIARIDNKRNAMLENWKHMAVGGRSDLIDAFKNLAGALMDFLTPMKQVFDEIFGTLDSRKLASIVKSFKDWTESIRLNAQQQENLRIALHYILTPLKVIVEVIKFFVKLIPSVARVLADIMQLIIAVGGILGQLLKQQINKHLDDIKAGLLAIKEVLSTVASAIRNILVGAFTYFTNALKDSNSWISKTINALRTLGAITLAGLMAAFNSLANFKFSDITSAIEKIKNKIKELGESNKLIKGLMDAFEKLKEYFNVIKVAAEVFFESLIERVKSAQTFGEFLQAVWDSLKDGYEFLKEFIESKFFTDGPGLFDTIKKAFQDFVSVLEGGMDKIPWAKIILIAFTAALVSCTINLVTAISKFGSLAGALAQTVSIVNSTIKSIIGIKNKLIELKTVALYITVVATAIGALAMIDAQYGNLTRVAVTLGVLAAGLMVLAEALVWINAKNAFNLAGLTNMMASLAGLAAATVILAAAAAALKDMSLSLKESLPYIETLGVLMLGLVAAMTVLTLVAKDHKIFTIGATSIIAYASAVYILAKGLTQLAGVKFVDINSLLKILGETFIGFATVTALAGKFGNGKSLLAIVVMAATLKLVAVSLKDISQLSFSEDAKKLLDMVMDLAKYIISAVAVFGTISKIFGKSNTIVKVIQKNAGDLGSRLSGIALIMVAAAASLFVIVKTFEKLNSLLNTGKDWGTFAAVLVVYGVIIAAIAVLFTKIAKAEHSFSKGNKALAKFSASLLMLTASLVPLSACLVLIADLVKNGEGVDLGIAGAIIVGVAGIMSLLMVAAGKLKLTSFKSILSVFAGFGLIIAELIAVTMLVEGKGDAMAASLGLLLGVATILSLTLLSFAEINKRVGAADINSLVVTTSALVVLCGVLTGLTFLVKNDTGNDVWEAFGLLASIAGVMVGALAAIRAVGNIPMRGSTVSALIATMSGVIAFAGVLAGIVFLNETGNDIWEAVKILGVICGELVLTFGLLATVNKLLGSFGDWATFLSFAAVIAAVAGSLLLLVKVPWEDLAIAAGIMVLFTGAMVGLLAILTAVVDGSMGTAGLVLVAFAASVTAMSLAMAVLVAAAGTFINAITKLINALTDLGRSGEEVKRGLDVAIPSIIKAFNDLVDALVNAAPRIAVAIAAIVTGIGVGIAQATPVIAAAIAEAWSILQPVIVSIMETARNMLVQSVFMIIQSLIENVPHFYETGYEMLVNFVSGLLDQVEAKFGVLGSTYIRYLLIALNPLIGIAVNIGLAVKDSFFSSATPTEGEMKVVTESYGMMGANSMSSFMEGQVRELSVGEKKIKSKAESIPASVVSAMKDAGNKGSKSAKESVNKINDALLAGYSDVAKNYKTNVEPMLNKFKNDIGENGLIGAAKNFASEGLGSIVDYAKDKFLPNFDDLENSVKDLTENLTNSVPAANSAGAAMEGAGKSASKGAKGVKELNDEVSSYVEKMEGAFNILDEFDLGLDEENPLTGDKILQNMQSNIQGMTQWSNELSSLGTKISTGLYKKLADMGPTGYKYVHAFASMTMEQLDLVNQYYAQSLIIPASVTAEVYSGMNATASNAYTGFINGLNIPGMQAAGIQMGVMLLSGVNSSLGIASPSKRMYEKGMYSIIGFAKGLLDSSGQQVLITNINTICRDVIEKFRKGLTPNNFTLIGRQITDGLSRGIYDGKSEVVNAVARVCQDAVIKARSTLLINSPSKVFAKIGSSIDEGFAKGVTDNMNLVNDSVDKMANSSIDNMREAIEKIQMITEDDLNVEPVIRPVVDLSNVQNGVNSINSIMGNTFGSGVNMPQAKYMSTSQLVSTADNSEVVAAVNSLKSDITGLKDSMTNIKMYLDTGTMVGAMVEDIDNALGRRMVYAGRGI